MLKAVPIDELKPGMYVNQVLEQSGALKMRSKGIVCGVGVKHPLHELFGDFRKKLPNTEFAVNYSVALPTRPNLTENELNRIVIAVKENV